MTEETQITYCINKGTAADIQEHLVACDQLFVPPLSQKVSLQSYAAKIADKAVRFEAWSGGILAGLVAAYLNDTASGKGFITNVSVLPAAGGKGIAGHLMRMTEAFAQEHNFNEIWLEVHRDNQKAVHLYKRCGFAEAGSEEKEGMIRMWKPLQPENDSQKTNHSI